MHASPDYDLEQHREQDLPGGIEGLKAYMAQWYSAFPDLHFEILDTIAQGDRAGVRAKVSRTQSGEFIGRPPSNKRMEFTEPDLIEPEGEKSAAHWGVGDTAAIPAAGHDAALSGRSRHRADGKYSRSVASGQILFIITLGEQITDEESSFGEARMVRQVYSRQCIYESLGNCLVREFFHRTGHPVMVFEPEGKCLITNPAASIVLKEQAGIERIRDWSDIMGISGQVDVLDKAFRAAVDDRTTGKGVAELRPQDKARMFIGFELVPITEEEGVVTGVALTFTEVTEMVQGRALSAALNDINAEIGSAKSIDEIMDSVLNMASQALEAESAGATLREGDEWVVRYAVGDLAHKKGMTATDQWFRDAFGGLWKEGLVASEDVRLSPVNREMVEELGVRSVLAIPMSLRGEIIGAVLFPYRKMKVRFTAPQRDFAMKLAHVVSLALENAHLWEEETKERKLLQEIVDRSPAGIVVMNAPKYSVKLVNRVVKDYIGHLEVGGDLSEAAREVVPDKERNMIQEALDRSLREGRVVHGQEVHFNMKDGTEHFWNYIIAPIEQDGDRVVILAVNDVTSQVMEKESFKELARKEEEEKSRLRAILNTLPVGVLIVNADGRTVEYNAIRDRIWGHGRTPMDIEELSGHDARWADNGMKLKKSDWPIVRALKKRETVIGEVIDIRRGNGSIGTVIASAAPVIDGQGKVIGAVSVLQDIAGQRKLEQEAVQSKDKMELYLDLLSHDVNNLNAAAKGYLELVLDREKLANKAKRYVENSSDLLDQVSTLIGNVRKIQRLETEARSLTLMDLSWLLEEVQHEYEQVPGKDVSVEYCRGERRLVLANEILKDIFDNLVGNAVKHGGNDVEIRIRTSTYYEGGKEYHRVEVEDTGPGIPDDAKERLFQRFIKGKARGHGLGLYLVKRFVEDFNGRVWMEDRVPGDHKKGSRFVVLLPVAAIDTTGRVVNIE